MSDDFITTQAQAWHQIATQFYGRDTVNGPGSTMAATEHVRAGLRDLLDRHNVRTMLDAPCGDQNWIRHIDLDGIDYTGWDVVEDLVTDNAVRFPDRRFAVRNLLQHDFPRVDLILCRDFTIHLPTAEVASLLTRFKASGSHWLLTTHYPGGHNDYTFPESGHDNRPGYWAHPWNLEIAPFNLAGRVEAIREDDDHELVLYQL